MLIKVTPLTRQDVLVAVLLPVDVFLPFLAAELRLQLQRVAEGLQGLETQKEYWDEIQAVIGKAILSTANEKSPTVGKY